MVLGAVTTILLLIFEVKMGPWTFPQTPNPDFQDFQKNSDSFSRVDQTSMDINRPSKTWPLVSRLDCWVRHQGRPVAQRNLVANARIVAFSVYAQTAADGKPTQEKASVTSLW